MGTQQSLMDKAVTFWNGLTDTTRGISIGVAGTVGVLLLFSWATSDSTEDRAAKLQSAIDNRGAVLTQLDDSIVANKKTISQLELEIASKRALIEGVNRQLSQAGIDLDNIEMLRAQQAEMQQQLAEAERLKAEIADLNSRKQVIQGQLALVRGDTQGGVTVQDYQNVLDLEFTRVIDWSIGLISYDMNGAAVTVSFGELDASAVDALKAARAQSTYAGVSLAVLEQQKAVQRFIDWDAKLVIVYNGENGGASNVRAIPFSVLTSDAQAQLEAMRPAGQ